MEFFLEISTIKENKVEVMKRKINEELVSTDALKHVLCTICGCKNVHIHLENNDPPDFTVTVDDMPYPTEVTSIVSRKQYSAQCKTFARTIQQNATSSGILFGTYTFIISRFPIIPKPKSKNVRQLLNKALSYIGDTREQKIYPEKKLVQDNSGKISISKRNDTGSTVGLLWIAGMREGEIVNKLSELIQYAVDDKKQKLQDKGIEPKSALLLLYDAFGYAEPIDAFTAMEKVSDYDWFHSIFWAASFFDRENMSFPEEPGREGLFLFSHIPSWNRAGSISV